MVTRSYFPSRSAATAFCAVLLACAGSVSCNQDPNYAKKQWLESGNKYFERGRYKEALIMYRKALAKDPKFGEAYYRLALALDATGQRATTVGVLRRATELLPKGTPEWNDAALKLGGMLANGALSQDGSKLNQPLMDEVNQLQAGLDAKAPGGFEDNRLKAEVKHVEAVQANSKQDAAAMKTDLEESIGFLRKALSSKPGDSDTAVTLARSLSADGQQAEAEQIYRGLLDRNKTLAVGYLDLYRIYLAQHRNSEAEDVLKRAIANVPKDFSFRTILASYYLSQNNRPEVDRVLAGMKALYKDFPDAFLTAGDFYARIGDLDTAMKQYQEGFDRDPGRKSDYRKRMIEVLLRQNKRDEASAKIQEMLKDNPKDADARGMAATLLLDRGDVEKAVTELQAVIAVKPENFVARYNLGRALAAKGELQQAMEQYQMAIKQRPDYLRPRIALSEAQIQTGNFEGALQTAKEMETVSPGNPSARLLESIAYLREGKKSEAKAILDDLVTKYPQFPEAQLEAGVMYLSDKNYTAAREAFARSYKINPGDLRAISGQVETFLATNQPDEALALMKRETEAQPARSDLLLEYANLKGRLSQFDGALADYNTLLDRFKNNAGDQARIYFAMGRLEARKGNIPAAITDLEKARDLAPNSVPTFNFLGQLYQGQNRSADAIKAYRATLAIDSGNAEALNDLAYLLAESGTDLDEALTLANKAKQRLPNVPQVNDTMALIYLKKKLNEQAVDILRDVTAKNPEAAVYHYHYCMALVEAGDRAGALRECNSALAKKPTAADAEGAKQILARLH